MKLKVNVTGDQPMRTSVRNAFTNAVNSHLCGAGKKTPGTLELAPDETVAAKPIALHASPGLIRISGLGYAGRLTLPEEYYDASAALREKARKPAPPPVEERPFGRRSGGTFQERAGLINGW